MKTHLLSLTVLLAAAAPALAWPFVKRETGFGLVNAANQYDAAQWDTDHALEIVTGGEGVLQISATGQVSQTAFPQFDYTPYAAGIPEVTFQGGRATAGDIDGDGDIDVVRSAYLYYNNTEELNSGRLMTCRNNGNGTFTRTWHWRDNTGSVSTLGRAPSLKLADLDRDGDLDVIETYARVRIHWNPGDGDFSAAPLLIGPAFRGVAEIEIADFDGDGWQDIALFAPIPGLNPAVPAWTAGRFIMLRNNALTWSAATVHTNAVQFDYGHTACADFNGDGKPDLVALAQRSGGMEAHYYHNTGAAFGAPAVLDASATAYSNAALAAGDLDEDGIPDIVINGSGDGLSWLRGTGGPAFAALATIRATSQVFSPRGICVADVDGDGDNDVVTAGGSLIFENTAIHREAAARVVEWTGTDPSGTVDLTTGDLNTDGKPDLIAADGGGRRILWFSGNGTGLGAQLPISTSNLEPAGVAAGDFNGDGFTDLTWAASGVLKQALSQNGVGLAFTHSDVAVFLGMSRILPMDFDLDGDLDVLAISPSQNSIRWLGNTNGAGVWPGVPVSNGALGVAAMACGQQVPGGRPEVATASVSTTADGSTQRYAWNGASWIFNHVALVAPPVNSSAVIMADVQDSTPGLETLYALGGTFSLHHPALPGPVIAGFGGQAVHQLAAADWNGDGYTDILSATGTGVNLYLHQRGSDWNAQSPTPLYTGTAQQDLVIIDLDADGLPDAVSVEATTGKLRLIYNTSAAIRRALSTTTASAVLVPSQGAILFRQICYNRGTYYSPAGTADASAAPADVRFRFLNAVSSGGTWVPGSPLTQTQVSALVENVAIESGEGAATASPSSVNVNGYFIMSLPAAARTALRLAPLAFESYDLKLRLKSTAASAGISRFFVELHPESQWAALDAGNAWASGPSPLSTTPGSIQRSLIAVDIATLLDTWRLANFGSYDVTTLSANDADPDGDRIPNLLEYVSSQNPNSTTGLGAGPVVGLTHDFGLDVMIADLRLLTTYDSKVRLTLQYSLNPAAGWSQLSTRTGTGAWSLAPISTTLLSGGSRTRFNFDGGDPAIFPKAFYRLKAEELP